jgi:hypothetical protein
MIFWGGYGYAHIYIYIYIPIYIYKYKYVYTTYVPHIFVWPGLPLVQLASPYKPSFPMYSLCIPYLSMYMYRFLITSFSRTTSHLAPDQVAVLPPPPYSSSSIPLRETLSLNHFQFNPQRIMSQYFTRFRMITLRTIFGLLRLLQPFHLPFTISNLRCTTSLYYLLLIAHVCVCVCV